MEAFESRRAALQRRLQEHDWTRPAHPQQLVWLAILYRPSAHIVDRRRWEEARRTWEHNTD